MKSCEGMTSFRFLSIIFEGEELDAPSSLLQVTDCFYTIKQENIQMLIVFSKCVYPLFISLLVVVFMLKETFICLFLLFFLRLCLSSVI